MTVYTGTPTTLVAGDTSALVTKFNDHRDALLAVTDALTSYTPTYAGITGIGNATVSAKYQQVGKLVRGHVRIVFGTTSTFAAAGTTITVSLPVATHASIASNHPIGPAFFLDAGVSGTRTIGTAITTTSTTVFFVTPTVGQTVLTSVPWTWANTDTLAFSFEYEAA